MPGEITMSENTVAVTDASFDLDVINSDVPVLLDFWVTMVRPMQNDRACIGAGRCRICG